MKYILVAVALLGLSSGKKLKMHSRQKYFDGANDGHLYDDTKPNHWRYTWPEGHVDNADGDAEVINAFSLPEKKKPEKFDTETYAW